MKSTKMIFPAVLSILVGLTAVLQAGVVSQHYTFSAPEVVETEDGVKVLIEDTRLLGYPGEPLLPIFGAVLLLPPGEAIERVEIIPGDLVTIPGNYFVFPTQEEYPLSYIGPYEPVSPKREIYESDAPYPPNPVTHSSTQFYRGYSIGYAAISPVVYYPNSGQISYYSSVDVVFHTNATANATAAFNTMLRGDENTLSSLANKVDNSQRISNYPLLDETDEIATDYVIITSNDFVDEFEVLADFKNRRGVSTIIETVENIAASFTGVDLQDKIRNYIIYAYGEWSIDYVLLAADDEILPHRGLYASAYTYTDDDIASDLYYGGLDGNWNNDGDSYWGEIGEDDLEPEVAVGRAAIDASTEAVNFINKQIMYQQSPVSQECDNALFVGEELWSDVYCEWTFGATYKDEVRLGSSNHGYTTVGLPTTFETTTLYDLTICPSSWSAMGNLLPLLNSGFNFVNHLGHSNVTYCMRFNNSDVNDVNFTNDGVNHGFWVGYSQGCYDGSFDNRTTSGSYTEDCICEVFTTIQHGPVGFIGNSRYGWGDHQSTNGSSQYFDRQFFDAIFGEDITRIGPANDDSKVDNIWAISYAANRWCYYELNVFGDPELDLWTDVPQTMIPTFPSAYVIGQDTLRVTVTGVEGACVALSFDNALVGRGYTNSTGEVEIILDNPPDEPGIMTIVITAHDYLEYTDDIQVVPPSGAYVLYRSHTINDAAGNNNGLLDFGEDVTLTLTIENVGNDNATGITVVLSSDDPNITITDNTEFYGNISAHAQATISDGFAFSVIPEVPDEHIVVFDITATSAAMDEWEDDFAIITHAPIVTIMSFDIDDAAGNDNGRLDPGESVDVDVTLENTGSADVSGILGSLSTDYTNIIINPDMASLALLPSGNNGVLTPSFGVQASSGTPYFSRAVFYLAVNGIRDYNHSLLHELTVGGYYEDVESGAGLWIHTSNTGWADQWHISSEDAYSPTHAWKCGDSGTGEYANSLDALLTTPTITIAENTELRFWHWMEAENSGYYPDSAYDGGVVYISLNLGPWQLLTPEGGYSHHIRYTAGGGNPYTGPFDGGTPCFSGVIEWEQVTIDLSSYSGDIRLQFRFGSDQSAVREGWYIDEVEIVLTDDLEPPSDLRGHMIGTYAHLDWNSPGVDGLLGYNIYRNSEQIGTLFEGLHYQDNLDGLPIGTYTYQVTAVYDAGESAFSDPVNIDYTGGLQAIEDLVAKLDGANIVLDWSTIAAATEYNIYRGTDPYAAPAQMNLISTTTDTTYTDPGIINGADDAVFYVVTAVR